MIIGVVGAVAHMLTDYLLYKHGCGFLHIIGAGMQQRYEGEIGSLGQIIAMLTPWHEAGGGCGPLPFLRVYSYTCWGRGVEGMDKEIIESLSHDYVRILGKLPTYAVY